MPFNTNFMYLLFILAVLGVCCCAAFSLVAESGDCSPTAVRELLLARAPPVAEHGRWVSQASVAVTHRLSICGFRAQAQQPWLPGSRAQAQQLWVQSAGSAAVAPERRLSSCGFRAQAQQLWVQSAGSAAVVLEHRLSSCGSRAPERRLSICGFRAQAQQLGLQSAGSAAVAHWLS